ncbi:MAG: fibronectin type III domain-containing protein [Halanaerobiales bacterium]
MEESYRLRTFMVCIILLLAVNISICIYAEPTQGQDVNQIYNEYNLQDQDTHINILPGVNVEVGEEVYFDGIYYQDEYDPDLQWEWDFGDGYTLKAGEPWYGAFDTGLAVVHYFMKPGIYEVKLTVSRFDMNEGPPVRLETLFTDSVTVNVSGEEAIEGFELWHAPFHARTAQYLYALVPDGYMPEQVSLRVESLESDYVEEISGITEDGRQKFLLQNAELSAGEYVIIAELRNGQEVVSRIREKLSKPYDGPPEVGINENNAFILNGEDLFFPMSPFILNKGNAPLWKKICNTLHSLGYYETRDHVAWKDYVEYGNSENLMTLGPTGWIGKQERHTDPADFIKYVETAKDSEGLLGWCWDDEPRLGGRYERIPSVVLAAWTYRVKQLDSQHPNGQQYYGYSYLPYYNPLNNTNGYDFMGSAGLYGGKQAFNADFFTFDIYPIEAKEHPSLVDPERGVIDLWLEALDNFTWNMGDMVPLGTFVETQNVDSYNRMSNHEGKWDAGPTPGDLRTQLWSAVVHGMKYIGYFQFFSPTTPDNMSVMGEFKEAVTDLTPIILSEPSDHPVTHNCTTRGSRVDIMVRETPGELYVFAARVTEPESEWDECMEPETIEFEFDTGMQSSIAYDIFPTYQWKYQLFDVDQAQTEFELSLDDSGIKPGSVILGAVEGDVPTEAIYDRWTGKEYSPELDHTGNIVYGYDEGDGEIVPLYWWENYKGGTINYETGDITLEFGESVPIGKNFIQIAYAVEDRQERTLTGTDGVFTDSLERNAVRIYRIPKVYAPVITEQPKSQTVIIGSDVSLSVAASGFPEPEYQWYYNDQTIEGATSDTLVINNVQEDDQGIYMVAISNSVDSVTSDEVNIEVIEQLPVVENFDGISEYHSAYLSWDIPDGQGSEWDKLLLLRKEGSTPVDCNDGYIINDRFLRYNGTGCSYMDRNLNEGNYHYAVYTYKEYDTNTVYSDPVTIELNIPQFYNKEYLKIDGEEQDILIGQNTRSDLYTIWNSENLTLGKGPGGNATDLWLYSDIIGDGEGQVPAGSEIVSARLVFKVAGISFLNNSGTENQDINDWNITNDDITDVNLPHNILIYQIIDPDNLGIPHYAEESGLKVGLDFNYRDHRPGVNITWMNHEEDFTQNSLDNSDGIFNIFEGIEPVDILEFYPEVFRDEIADEIQFDITEAVQAWVEGEVNHGLFITAGQDWNNGEELSLSGITVDDERQSVRPFLEIIYGDSVDDLTGPEAVCGLEIIPGEDSFELSWINPDRSITPNQDMVGAKIIRREGIVPFNHQDDAVVTILECNDDINNSYIDTALEIGKTYYYAVYTFDEEHNYSEKVWIKGTPNSPDAPTFNRNPVIDSGSVTINWNTVVEADEYRIYRKGNSGDLGPEENSGNVNHEHIPGNLKCIEISEGSAGSYEDYLSLGKYTYWMTAVNEYGEGPVSEVISVEINDNNLAADKPVEPTLFSGEAISSSEVRLSWVDNSTNESGFVIERINESNEYEEISSTVYNTTVYIDRGLRPGTLYQYRIKAVNSAGESDYAECEVRTEGIANITWEVISATHVKLRWEDGSDERGYTVKLMDLDGDVLDTQYLLSDTDSCILGGLEPGKEYRAEISADIDSNVEEECVSVSDIIRTAPDSKGGLF